MNFLKGAALVKRMETLGVRPEHLGIARTGAGIAARVSHVEKWGDETLVYAHAEPHGLLTVRLFGEHDFAVDEAVRHTPDPARCIRFDAARRRMR